MAFIAFGFLAIIGAAGAAFLVSFARWISDEDASISGALWCCAGTAVVGIALIISGALIWL